MQDEGAGHGRRAQVALKPTPFRYFIAAMARDQSYG